MHIKIFSILLFIFQYLCCLVVVNAGFIFLIYKFDLLGYLKGLGYFGYLFYLFIIGGGYLLLVYFRKIHGTYFKNIILVIISILCLATGSILATKIAMSSFTESNDVSIVLIEGPANLIKKPYPLNYPSTNPQPNEVISNLKAGDEGEVLDWSYEKDYKVYKVKMKDGKVGYLIHGENFKELTKGQH